MSCSAGYVRYISVAAGGKKSHRAEVYSTGERLIRYALCNCPLEGLDLCGNYFPYGGQEGDRNFFCDLNTGWAGSC